MNSYTAQSLLQEIQYAGVNSEHIQESLVAHLNIAKKKIATAESCTGGLVSARITEVSGSSSVFECGICSYGNNIKTKVLGVREETLESFGAVSSQTAIEMANGVRLLSKSDIGISTTGIAGPTGGTAEKPVGLVYIGCSTKEHTFAVKAMLQDSQNNSRCMVRDLACKAALFTALKEILNQQ